MEDTAALSAPGPFLKALASKTSTPGGGGAAALVGAIAAALSSMTGQFTMGKKKYAAVEEEVKKLTMQCEQLVNELNQQVETDAIAFDEVMAAYRDKSDQQESLMQAALKKAVIPPQIIMQKSVEAMKIADRMLDICNPNLRTDAGATGVFGLAAVRVASWNIKINLLEITEPALKEKLAQEMESLLAEATALEEKIRTKLESTLEKK